VLEVFPSNSFSTEPLRAAEFGSGLQIYRCGCTHTAVAIKILKVDPCDLDGDSAAMVNSSKYIRVPTALGWIGFFTATVRDVH